MIKIIDYQNKVEYYNTLKSVLVMKGFPKIYTGTMDSQCCCQLSPPELQSIPVAYICLSIFLNGVRLLDA